MEEDEDGAGERVVVPPGAFEAFLAADAGSEEIRAFQAAVAGIKAAGCLG